MKKAVWAIILLLLAFVPGRADAAVYTFTPDINGPTQGGTDLRDLDHYYYYSWRIGWEPAANEEIISAIITIDNIRDWTSETDQLAIYLLDEVNTSGMTWIGPGVWQKYDGQSKLAAPWDDPKTLAATWSDPNDSTPRPFVTYDLSYPINLSVLEDYSANGFFGFGFDPDCHYYNDGIQLRIETVIVGVPESSALLLFSAGIVGLIGYRRKRRMT